MKKKIIIGVLIAALVIGGSAGGAVYYKNSHQKTVSVVSVDSLAGQYYMDDTNLDGNIVTSAVQNINVDKDMIIKEVYVAKGDTVKKGDQLMSFDMTLVQMELNIAKLKQQQQEQDLNKAVSRLNSLKNGGKIEESDGEALDTSSDTTGDTDTSSMDDSNDDLASAGGSVNGSYLAAVIQPVLAAAVEAAGSDTEEATADAAGANMQQNPDNTENTGEISGDNTDSSDNSEVDTTVDFEDTDPSDSEDTDPSVTPALDDDSSSDTSDSDFSDTVEVDSDEKIGGPEDLTDGDPMFYQVLDKDTEPYTGTGTQDDPYVFLCSSAKGYVIAKGSFLNKMAAYEEDGTKTPGRDGYWYQLEFHQNDTIADPLDRKSSCTGYYLVDGGLLKKKVTDTSEVEFSLDGASHYDETPDDNGGDGGDSGGGDSGDTTLTREEAIKIQQNKIDSLKLDIRESKLNIEKLEKKVKKEVIYSKLDGTVAKVGDPVTGTSDGSSFMTIKSKEGYYVKGTVSELMLDQVKEGTILNCSTQSDSFEAEVVDVSEYPVSGDNYSGNGNPNVSYYTYTATIPDKSIKVSDEDWLTISLTSSAESKGIVLDKAFVRSENGVSYVYKDDNGVLKKQVLTVGGNVNGGYSVLITGGITRDDKIAFPYGDTVQEGAKTQEVTSDEIYGY